MDDPTGLATQALGHMARGLEPAAENTPIAPFLDALHRIEATPARATTAPDGRQDLPVLRHLPAALAAAAAVDAQLARTLAALSPCLSWRQNPNYVRQPPARRFLENYGYAVIAGPGGIIPARLAAGVLLLGPGTLYPAHAHPAEEIYLVLDAMSAWWREGEP